MSFFLRHLTIPTFGRQALYKKMKKLYIAVWAAGLFVACGSPNTQEQEEPIEPEAATPEVVDGHTSRNSLDWAGTYRGELPCTDCDAIDMEVTIDDDNTFMVKAVMKGKDEIIEDSGIIRWENNDSHINLRGDAVDYHFRVGENQLTFLLEAGILPEEGVLVDYSLDKVE